MIFVSSLVVFFMFLAVFDAAKSKDKDAWRQACIFILLLHFGNYIARDWSLLLGLFIIMGVPMVMWGKVHHDIKRIVTGK